MAKNKMSDQMLFKAHKAAVKKEKGKVASFGEPKNKKAIIKHEKLEQQELNKLRRKR